MALVFTIALHLLAIYFWPAMSRHPAMRVPSDPALFVFLRPSQSPPMHIEKSELKKYEVRGSAPPKQRRTSESRVEPLPITTASPGLPPSGSEANPQSANVPSTANRMDDILSITKRDIGKIDRDLRKEFPKLQGVAPNSIQARLSNGIAAAAKPSATMMQEKVLSDGRRITKVSGPGGSYCVQTNSVGATDGVDQMQRGIPLKVTNCGSLFD